MIGIGWYLNLRYEVWRISPKPKAVDKIFAALFFRLPLDVCDEGKVFRLSRRTFLEIAGLLAWYSEVLCVGKAFVHSLFACAEWGNMEALHTVSLNAKRDIWWWRVISIASMKDPRFMSTPISHLRRKVEVDIYLISDASTTIGGGGWFSQSNIYDESEDPSFESFIRWTEDELRVFAEGIDGKAISINVLQYFTETKVEAIDIKDSQWWRGQSRQTICRHLLKASISRPSSAPLSSRLELLRALL